MEHAVIDESLVQRVEGIEGDKRSRESRSHRGNVSDHIVMRAANLYWNARPATSAAIHLPAINATKIADAREKLSIILGTNTSGSIRNPVAI
jgi:hypothetical protein